MADDGTPTSASTIVEYPDDVSGTGVPNSPSSGEPGVLRGVVTLTLETRQAQRLVKGRPGSADKPAIIGLIGFANLLRNIWQGAKIDDPYADWWLIKIDEALESADQALQTSIDAVQHQLQVCDAISAMPGTSVKPVRTPLRFSNPYAFRGARRLADYDRLARVVLSAKHIGAIGPKDCERILAFGARQLRRAYLSPMGYQMTGVNRADVQQRNARCLKAMAGMGEVPAEILTGEQRPAYAPSRSVSTLHLSSHLVRVAGASGHE